MNRIAPAPLDAALAAVTAPRWSLPRRVGFRFVFTYLVLYIAPFPLDLVPIPAWKSLLAWPDEKWAQLADAFAQHVLHLPPLVVTFNGSGDRLSAWMFTLVQLLAAALLTLVWSILDRRRPHYRALFDWLHVYVRLCLLFYMLSYGFSKVIKTQFPMPSPERLQEPLGEMSPMGLLWSFMGASAPYTIFAGALEVLGGLLLVFRRTATLGALVTAAVMTNVFMLNLCYDVPVKLFSGQLLGMALLLAAPDLSRLFRVLVLHQAVPASAPRGPVFRRRWMRVSARLLMMLFVGYSLFGFVTSRLERYARGDGAPEPAHAGVWDVDELVQNGEVRPPLTTDAARWRWVSINRRGELGLQRMTGGRAWFDLRQDPGAHTFTLTDDPLAAPIVLSYRDVDDTHLELEGQFGDDYLTVRLHRQDDSKALVLNRGFHWVNDFPYNR